MQTEATRRSRWETVAWAAEQSGMSEHFFYERAKPAHPEFELFRRFLKHRGKRVMVEVGGFTRWLHARTG